jgi:membrane protein DedA with SNARE-associated domain
VQDQLLEWIARFSYPAVALLLASTGVGLPVSEDVVLLTAGTMAGTGRALLALMIPVACAGVFVGDTLLFRIGAKLGPKIIEHPRLKKILTPARVEKVRARFARHGAMTIFVARFLPGVRMPTFLLAGSLGITQRRFWLADGPAIAIFAPAMVWVGYTFGTSALPYVRAFGAQALLALVAALAVYLLATRLKARRSAP